MTSHIFFLVGFGFLLVHEMDAVRCHEWRLFPILRRMNDRAGYVAFTAVHVPIYALLLLGLTGGSSSNQELIVGLDVFFVVHLIAHILLRDHRDNQFTSWFSWSLFTGAGVCGVIDLALGL